jgi:multiple sugar transport system substrate-binding protein
MRAHSWRAVLATTTALALVGGCSGDDSPAEEPVVPATTSCAATGDLTMWERSGGNKQMVDLLVEAWNTKNPTCTINLTYIPHT